MKINWGTGLVIGMVAFIGFIMVMVVTMLTNNEYDHDMVTENYYEKDLVYQTQIDAEKKANTLSAQVQYQKTDEGVILSFPKEIVEKNITGMIQMYRPSNEKLDFDFPLSIKEGKVLIPKQNLVPGLWKIIVSWEIEGEKYLFKKEIIY